MYRTRDRAALLGLTLSLGTLAVVATLWSFGAGAHGATKRYADPLVVPGSYLGALGGAPVAELSVWIRHHGEWARVLHQVDEVAADGTYRATEDRTLDGNDELVVVLGDLGEQAPADAWPEGLDRDRPRVEIKVTDPLDEALGAWFYVFRSARSAGATPEPVVAWNAAEREIRTAEYTVGLADQSKDGFIGMKRLSLYGDDANLLDRLKIRGTLSAFGSEVKLTEETLLGALQLTGTNLSFDPVIFGPLRVVLQAGGYAYANRFAPLGELDLGMGGGTLPFRDARISLDFRAAAAPALYIDPNVPDGVTIDGRPDSVPQAPAPAWREISFASGRLVVLSKATGAGSPVRAYYKDDETRDGTDTGDKQSWGDSGVTAPDLETLLGADFPGEAVVLPVGRQVSAAQLAANRASPLEISVDGTAVVVPTPGAPAATVSPTRTATRLPQTATRTPGGSGLPHIVRLPYCGNARP